MNLPYVCSENEHDVKSARSFGEPSDWDSDFPKINFYGLATKGL